MTYFLALNLALAASKLLFAFFLAANNKASYLLQSLTYAIFLVNLTFNTAIYLANLSFLLANFLLSFYNKPFMLANDSFAFASFSMSLFLLAISLASNWLRIFYNTPLISASALTVF